eukprot:c20280_g1_i1 orf=352-1956(-)
MLASPGHSPRHILPSPSTPSNLAGLDVGGGFGKTPLTLSSTLDPGRLGLPLPLPPPKRIKRSQVVLDEDTYVAAIERIIERDFFPDIPKLQNRLEWLEAVRSGDPVLIRGAQMNIIQRRQEKGSERAGKEGTPASIVDPFVTPGSILGVSPASSLRTPAYSEFAQPPSVMDSKEMEIDTSLSLDEFLKQFTSEDNVSFAKILDKVNKQRREKYRFLSEEIVSPQLRITERATHVTDGYGTSGQPESTLNTWQYRAKNFLMYDSAEREGPPLTDSEKEEMLKGLTKGINIASTRFHSKMFDSKLREEDGMANLYPPVPGATPASAWHFSERDTDRTKKKYDLEDLRRTPQVWSERKNTVKIGTSGYNYVTTPSPAPGVDESPFMTWGEIEGTPLRLETEDTPVGIGGDGDGPHFKIPAAPSRDATAHSLSRDAARNLREKSRLYRASVSPSPARGSGSPALKCLSAAAQKFVRNAMAKTSASVDVTLRASYRAGATPGTPKIPRHVVSFRREGSVASREGSVPLQSPAFSEGRPL